MADDTAVKEQTLSAESMPLADLRVLDLSESIHGSSAAKWMAGMGAAVIKVEPPAGDALRRAGPFPNDEPDPERGGLFQYLNTGKQGITLDISVPAGRDLFLRLVPSADLVIESFAPGTMASLGLGYDALRKADERVVLTSVTPFGQTGPYRDYRATEAGIHAISGEMVISGELEIDGVPSAPLKKGGNIAQYLGGLNAFNGSMGALFEREQTGLGQHVDVSVSESLTASIGKYLREALNTGHSPVRFEAPPAWPAGIRPCKDGYVFVMFRAGGNSWPDFCALLAEEGDAPVPPTERTPKDPAERAKWDVRLDAWLLARTKTEVYHESQLKRLPFGPVSTATDMLASKQLAHRGFLQQVTHPVTGPLTLMGLPFLINGARGAPGRAPLLGEHNDAVYRDALGLSTDDLAQLRAGGVIS